MKPLPSEGSTVNVLDSIRFVFDDAEWKSNVLLGMVFMFIIPVVGPIVFQGWLCEIHQRLTRNHPQPVPKLDFQDFGHYLGRGIVPFLVQLIMLMPIWLLMVLAYMGTFLGVMASTAIVGEPLVAVLVVVGGGAVVFVAMLIFGVLFNATQTRAELTENFGESLSPRGVLGYVRTTWTQALVKGFLFSMVAFGIVLVGMALLCVGAYPASVVVQVASAHLRWQIYRYHATRGGEPITIKEPQPLPSEAMRPHFMSGSYGGF